MAKDGGDFVASWTVHIHEGGFGPLCTYSCASSSFILGMGGEGSL